MERLAIPLAIILLALVFWQITVFSEAIPQALEGFGISLPPWALAMAGVIIVLLVLLYAINKLRLA